MHPVTEPVTTGVDPCPKYEISTFRSSQVVFARVLETFAKPLNSKELVLARVTLQSGYKVLNSRGHGHMDNTTQLLGFSGRSCG